MLVCDLLFNTLAINDDVERIISSFSVCVCVQRGYTETGRSLEMCGYIVINVYLSMVVVSVC